jgi:hypothetical protein
MGVQILIQVYMCDRVVDHWKNVGSNGEIVIPVVTGMNLWKVAYTLYKYIKPGPQEIDVVLYQTSCKDV